MTRVLSPVRMLASATVGRIRERYTLDLDGVQLFDETDQIAIG